MALPPLPANNTARLFVDYTTGVYPHSLVCRLRAGVSVLTGLGAVAAFLAPLQDNLPQNWAVTGARFQAAGAAFSLPVALGELTGFEGTNGEFFVGANQEPRQTNFTGRSIETGRDVRVGLFGLVYITPGNFRLTRDGISLSVGAALDELATAQESGAFCAIDGATVLWNQYGNVNYNSYWETEVRG